MFRTSKAEAIILGGKVSAKKKTLGQTVLCLVSPYDLTPAGLRKQKPYMMTLPLGSPPISDSSVPPSLSQITVDFDGYESEGPRMSFTRSTVPLPDSVWETVAELRKTAEKLLKKY